MPKPRDKLRRYMIGGARIGSAGSYTDIAIDGTITQAGTATNTFSGTSTLSGTTTISGALTLSNTVAVNGVATIAAAPVLSGSGRPTRNKFIWPTQWNTNSGSVALATLNSRWNSLYFTPSGSASDVLVYSQVQVPADLDTTYGITPAVWWSTGAKAASCVADWQVAVECVAGGEVSGTASTADVTAGASGTSASANCIYRTELDTIGANVIAIEDLLSLVFSLEGSDGLTTAGCPYFLGLEIEYKGKSI